MNARLLTARGAFDTRAGTGDDYDAITLREIGDLLRNPAAAPKDRAPFIIPSDYRQHDGRCHERQREAGRFWILAGDVDTGDHTARELDATVCAVFGHVYRAVYSTASATPERRKWRYLVPLLDPVPGCDYPDLQAACFELMAARGIQCDAALTRPGQPVYLPNVPPDRRDANGAPLFWQWHRAGRGWFDWRNSDAVVRMAENRERAHHEAQAQAREARERLEARTARYAGRLTPVQRFNREYALPELLERYGYARRAQSRNWRSPYQSGHTFATQDRGDGAWVSLSSSDAAAGLGSPCPTGCYGDAFDLFLHFEHRGDRRAAVRAAGELTEERA